MASSCKEKAAVIAEGIWGQLNLDRFAQTGSLSEHWHLRTAAAREAFAWCGCCSANRYFTDKAIREGIKLLVRDKGLKLPDLPGVTFEKWLLDSTKLVGHLCRRARRCTAMDPDNVETQPWPEDHVLCSLKRFFLC